MESKKREYYWRPVPELDVALGVMPKQVVFGWREGIHSCEETLNLDDKQAAAIYRCFIRKIPPPHEP